MSLAFQHEAATSLSRSWRAHRFLAYLIYCVCSSGQTCKKPICIALCHLRFYQLASSLSNADPVTSQPHSKTQGLSAHLMLDHHSLYAQTTLSSALSTCFPSDSVSAYSTQSVMSLWINLDVPFLTFVGAAAARKRKRGVIRIWSFMLDCAEYRTRVSVYSVGFDC